MKIIKYPEQIDLAELQAMATKMFDSLVKAVVDIETHKVILDLEVHSDGEQELLQQGAKQVNLWGINLHPKQTGDELVEFDSMINLRPSQGNRSRSVDDANTRKQIRDIIKQIIKQ